MPVLYSIFKILFRGLLKLFSGLTVTGKENIPENGPALIVANHISNWDPMVLGSDLKRQVKFIAKEELIKIPLIGLLIKAWGVVPIKRGRGDREAISKSLEILKNQHLMGIFIEGRRNTVHPEQMLKPQHGAAMLALKTGVPVIPAAIINSNKIFRSFKRVRVIIGAPIKFTEEAGVDKKELYEQISNQLVQEIMKLKRA
ncbi:MAG TPA: 1-acyl-sn-glycerol-3-phosphate acyltransferase [Firmicutes bacterium]|nr:1-acyl-sn-glycerol-3-phosphate acyltransferase [Bacillota bacterium]